ncbi:MAG: CoA transferase [Chloroflexi bacterium]|nr:CoA transferase [Chloroflexota bacterium]
MSSSEHVEAVLQGILVVDSTQALAGPYLAMMLGDLGADVIKVERPDGGDQARGWGPPFAGGESSYFMAVNRNKRSFTCNFKNPAGLEALHKLLDRADVFINNERREATRRQMGVDYATLAVRNPKLVYCSITGFGMSGPYEGRAGYDIIAQGMSGMMPLTGLPDSPPMRYPASIADLATAMYGLSAILGALLVRQRTGRGQYLDMTLIESQSLWSIIHAAAYFQTGERPKKLGNDHPSIVPYGTFRAQDGYLIIGCASESLWHKLCAILGLEQVRDDPRYCVNSERVQRRDEVRKILEERLAQRTVAEWCVELEAAQIPSGPIYDVPQMLADPHMEARGFIVKQEHPTAGTLRTLASPLHFSDTPVSYRLPPPLLGEHTDQVLRELGYSEEEIRRLHEGGAV